MHLSGLHIPLITPFAADGTVDLPALERLAHDHLTDGAHGLVALGTTGEPATLTDTERAAVIDRIAAVTTERGAVLTVGAGTNATALSAAAVAHVDPRAHYVLVAVPHYTRPSEAGVVQHFRAVAAASAAPVIVYDVPQRTGRSLGIAALREIAAIDGVAGFKHAVGSITDTTVQLLADSELSSDVAVLAGDDPFLSATLALGAQGAICASANVAAGRFAALVAAWRDGRVDDARPLGAALTRLACTLFAEPNPTVIKAVLAEQGRIATPDVRLPLLAASSAATVAARRLITA